MMIVSTGCPAGVGPEISVRAAAETRYPLLLVGDLRTLQVAAECVGVKPERVVPFDGRIVRSSRIQVLQVGPELTARDRKPGRPTPRSGIAQLAYIDAACRMASSAPGHALVTAPVSKAVVAHSGAPGAHRFRGHTEWLEWRDGAESSTMCFAFSGFATSLVTTHLPLKAVPRAIRPEGVLRAVVALVELLERMGRSRPRVAVCSLNPHAGEGELLGSEEISAIVPAIQRAKRRFKARAVVEGPVGAETAYRKARAGTYTGVVAMYHDQATIPMKLVAFGEAVNITWGLSFVRTSVDHGTGYDIAWQGIADAKGMKSALDLAARLVCPG